MLCFATLFVTVRVMLRNSAGAYKIQSLVISNWNSNCALCRYSWSRVELRRLLAGGHEILHDHLRHGRRNLGVPLLGK